MAVFVAASDETNTQGRNGVFVVGGYIAPESDWDAYFAHSWDERVLNYRGKRIPYFHTTELRGETKRKEWGITRLDAEGRFDEAARIIRSAGYLDAVSAEIELRDLRECLLEPLRQAKVGMYRGNKLPDYYCFMAFVITCLHGVRETYPDAERVDFVVERKDSVTPFLIKTRKDILAAIDPEAAALLGEIIPAGKDRVPLQAADFLMWHVQRRLSNALDSRADWRRFAALTQKLGHRGQWQRKDLSVIAERLIARAKGLVPDGE